MVDLDIAGTDAKRFWIVLERGVDPSICIEDPCLGGDRYVYVEADVRALYPIARGVRDWASAIADGSVRLFGDPALIGALPTWFLSGQEDAPARPIEIGAAASLSRYVTRRRNVWAGPKVADHPGTFALIGYGGREKPVMGRCQPRFHGSGSVPTEGLSVDRVQR